MSPTPQPELVQYSVEDRIATITLNRPEKLNAFTDDSVFQLAAIFRQFDVDPDADVAVIRGAGRAFSSGADVLQRQLRPREELVKYGSPQAWGAQANELLVRATNWKPIISAVHGYAIGMGLGLILETELIVAEEGTKFQVTETSRGLAPVRYWALMNQRGGGSFAIEATITGRFFTAEEALAAGVIDRVARQGEYLQVAYDLARQVGQNPPLSVRAAVRARRWYMEQAEREAYLQTAPLKLHLTEDFHESAKAFAEKRKAGPFKGR
jgi:enoyl-CoA hydratase/carnithine racemase